jgi:hypothetical protein
MSRIIGFAIRTIIKLKVILLSLLAGMAIATWLQAREQSRTWGLSPGESERDLPGDDLVAMPVHSDTRSLVIDAPPARVWSWLKRLGQSNAGWYSYGFLDQPWSPVAAALRRSRSLAGTGELAVGDVVATHPDGGFVAKVVEPERALVLHLDDDIVREQVRALAEKGSEGAARAATEMEDMPAFGFSWAFVLEPEAGDRTRLIERLRLDIAVSAPQRRLLPFMGIGAFTLMRSQMLGIKRRAEEGMAPAA